MLVINYNPFYKDTLERSGNYNQILVNTFRSCHRWNPSPGTNLIPNKELEFLNIIDLKQHINIMLC